MTNFVIECIIERSDAIRGHSHITVVRATNLTTDESHAYSIDEIDEALSASNRFFIAPNDDPIEVVVQRCVCGAHELYVTDDATPIELE